MSLTFREFAEINLRRCRLWHDPGAWSLADWAVATGGELGEAMNVIKRLNRSRDGTFGNKESDEELREALGKELADTLTYLFLLAAEAGIDLERETIFKFNEVSVRHNLDIFIPNPERQRIGPIVIENGKATMRQPGAEDIL